MSRNELSQLAILRRIRDVAAEQVEAVSADDLERFAELSAERDTLAAGLVPPSDPTLRDVATRLLREVLELDARARDALRTNMAKTRAELGQLRQGHHAVRAYAPRQSTQGVGARA